MLETIFTEGWKLNVLLYGLIFLLADYAVYKIIFAALVGAPQSYRYEDQKYWYRKASFLGAVIFAPLYEEIMFTYLAYSSFLSYAQEGKEGIVVLFVAVFFALLHLPGDLRQMGYGLDGRKLFLLLKFQLNRFFYSLAAYFIYQLTGQLWATIALHYFFNAVVSFYNFGLEDEPHEFERGAGDSLLFFILTLNIGFAFLGNFFFYEQYPQLGACLLPLSGLVLMDLMRIPLLRRLMAQSGPGTAGRTTRRDSWRE